MFWIEVRTQSLVLIFSELSLSTAKAANVNVESTEFKEKQQIVAESLTFENGIYSIDYQKAKEKLSDKEIEEISLFFKNVDNEQLETVAGFLNPSEEEFSIQALPVIVVAFLATLAAFVRWELASNITADFYQWGVTSACKKWKDVKIVKSFCTANDYL